MTTREVAEYLHCNPWTIYKLLRKGELPFLKMGRNYRFDQERIDKWIAEKERSPRSFRVRRHRRRGQPLHDPGTRRV
ncbi:MAG: helix-turn-helix domain-containing protein [Candidatus Binataceae bacterium]